MQHSKSPQHIHFAVFAHNEERVIADTLRSLVRAVASTPDLRCTIHLLLNGCSDGTEEIARRFANHHPYFQLHSLEEGDKNNAWNYYVYNVSPPGVHIFMDGDVRIDAAAPGALLRALEANPRAYIAAALPRGGRGAQAGAAEILRSHSFWGGLYAAADQFLIQVRARRARLIAGMRGDDGVLRTWAVRNFDMNNPVDYERVAPAPSAFFEYDPLPITSALYVKKYWQRRISYSLRYHQGHYYFHLLRNGGFAAIPDRVEELYRRCADVPVRPRFGIMGVFDRLAARRIRRIVKSLKPAV